jgi:outer membrane receptor protein involved in Fe transport
MRRVCFAAVLLAGVSSAALAQTPTEVAPLTIVGVTPLAGARLEKDALPASVQTATGADIDASHALDLSAFMARSLGGVYVNDIQNNPLQPDINYRGFTASPLLGTPQGLSVYMDGVRLNQPFGDVVSWDLIPRTAIADITLIPGSNPLFGKNTLGGTLSIRTKDGRGAPGTAIQLGYGSHDRRQAEFETGGAADNGLHWYLTGNRFQEDGWREDSPSAANQAFGKLGWSDGTTDLALSLAYADTDLNGNGLQEQRFLERDSGSVYTKPDNTRNKAGLANLTLHHEVSDSLSFSAAAYYRDIETSTYNGDINEDALTENVYQPTASEQTSLTAAGITGFPTSGETAANSPFPRFRCIANALTNDAPGERCNGLINRGALDQTDGGFSAQFTLTAEMYQLTVGAAYDSSRSHLLQTSQYGYLTPDRGVTGVTGPGAFADGSQGAQDAPDSRVDLKGRMRTYSLYATDTITLPRNLRLTLSARYDQAKVRNRDAVTPGGGPGSLDGDHSFSRLNPAAGLTWSPSDSLTAYLGYSQGSRAPSAIELGCADPENPCKLPNAMAGDPPLKQVVTHTFEAGLRGAFGQALAWNVGVFDAVNHDDILFVADDQAGFGYFKNFGQTRRRGVELGAAAPAGLIRWGANYTSLDATFESAEKVNGEANSSNGGPGPGFGGEIEIAPGDHIPLIPRHLIKANVQFDLTEQVTLNLDGVAVGGVYARGNENNQHQPDGVYYLGPGKTDAYAVFNLGADYRPTSSLKLFAQVNNLFDKAYSTAAQLGATGFNETGAFIARPFAGPVIDGERPMRNATFYAPGVPRSLWVGVRYMF